MFLKDSFRNKLNGQANSGLPIAHAILWATTLDQAWEIICQGMEQIGFDRLLYGRTHFVAGKNLGDEQDYMILSNHDPEYFDAFVKKGGFKVSPFYVWTWDNTGFISWSKTEELRLSEKAIQEALKIQALNAQHDVNAGFTVSFPNAIAGHKSAAAVCATKGISQEEVDSILESSRVDIETIWLAFDFKARSLPFPNSEKRLTARQLEVMQWYSKGKTATEIATILNVNPSTIEKHLRLSREALNVVNSSQAVTKLTFLNQLFIDKDVEAEVRSRIE